MPNHRARPAQSHPGNRLERLERIVLHDVRTNEAARPAESRFAVHRQRGGRLLAYGQEFGENRIARRAAVDKVEVAVLEAGRREAGRLVHAHVQPDDGADVVLAEVVEVHLGRMVHVAVFDFRLVVRSAERDKLLGQQPVEVAVLDELRE